MRDQRTLDPVAPGECRRAGRIGGDKPLRDQLTEPARERPGLLLDIDDAQRAGTRRFAGEPCRKPCVERVEPAHRIALCRVVAVQSVKDVQFIGRDFRSGDRIDRRHAAAGMCGQHQAVSAEPARLARL
jgi:hypothetical protein